MKDLDGTKSIESALVVLVPDAEPLVKRFRERHDPSAAQDMPAHITVLFPFKPPQQITAAIVTTLQDSITLLRGFTFLLTHVRRFPGVLYLAPEPDGPFKELTETVVKHFPETPPYGGAFGEVIPHLTIARVADPSQLDAIASEFMRVANKRLPVRARVAEVALMDNRHGRWQVRDKFPLGES